MHVLICGPHKHAHARTHRPMYSMVPLKNGCCLLNLNFSHSRTLPCSTILHEKRGAWAPENRMVRHLCPKRPLDELTGCVFLSFLFFIANTIPYTVYKSVVSQMDTKGKTFNSTVTSHSLSVFHVIFLAQNHAFFYFMFFLLNWTNNFFLLLLFKAKFSCISVSAQDWIDLWFFYLALLFFLKSWSGDGILSPLI